LLRDGEPRRCLTRAEAFFTRCGECWRLRWATHAAHKRLSEWDPAIADATGLVAQFPDDRDDRIWRGLAYAEKGDTLHAVADYEQALAIEPRLADVPFNLADAYRKLGRPCDGTFRSSSSRSTTRTATPTRAAACASSTTIRSAPAAWERARPRCGLAAARGA
jgi:tetratricopeptide (TPR) repeat protein